jgi:acyl-CoA reductase-like NAD-dependent aldehyde dehydrogenase
MAKNKTSKFGVADDLQYKEQQTQGTAKMTPEEAAQILEQTKKILESVSPEVAEQITRKQGRPPKADSEKLRGYRYNLNLDRDLKEYLHDAAWRKRTSITQYINDLIRADMENDEEWMQKKE